MGEPTGVRRHIDTSARHGFVYQVDGSWILEHATDGDWHACPLTEGRERRPLPPDASRRQVGLAAMRDLARRPHRGPLPELLKGSEHR